MAARTWHGIARARGGWHTAARQAPQYLTLALVVATIDFAVMLAYAGVDARAARVIWSSAAKWLDRICGGTLIGLAATLALYRRATN